jgi:hypothetical protein
MIVNMCEPCCFWWAKSWISKAIVVCPDGPLIHMGIVQQVCLRIIRAIAIDSGGLRQGAIHSNSSRKIQDAPRKGLEFDSGRM